ncbi:MAG: GGDEF domain-containing protein [Halioglobus sp.]|nr:GGDEF domain-containing protein [Halioglobus sp.]
MPPASREAVSEDLRNDAVNRILLGTLVITLLGVPMSLIRTLHTGWLPLYAVHLVLGALAIGTFVLRHRLPLGIRIAVIVGLFTAVGIGGLIQLGLLGVGTWWLVVVSLLIGMFHSARMAVIAGSITLLLVLVVAWGFVNGFLQLSVDAQQYVTSWSSWITLIIAVSVMPFFVFQAVHALQMTTERLLEQVMAQRDEIDQLATYDQLTGLLRSHMLDEHLHTLLAISRRNGQRLALMFVDLDGFKAVNDTLGHAAGDALLAEIASRYRASVREEDAVLRVGGDEFVFILGAAGSDLQIAAIARRVLAATTAPFPWKGESAEVSASVGISVFPDHGSEPASLQRLADMAMYRVKESGKNGYRFAAAPPQSDAIVAGPAQRRKSR